MEQARKGAADAGKRHPEACEGRDLTSAAGPFELKGEAPAGEDSRQAGRQHAEVEHPGMRRTLRAQFADELRTLVESVIEPLS